jgi:hypothetical protein
MTMTRKKVGRKKTAKMMNKRVMAMRRTLSE